MKSFTPQEREAFLVDTLQQLIRGELTEGQTLRKLRKRILDMNQEQYATLVKVSRRTLSDIENDLGNQSIAVLNTVFKPLGLRLGLLPTSQRLLGQLLDTKSLSELALSNQRLAGFTKQ